jgi:CheY-like chemotaxis protein/anti-sigma regulatory factor (Ser/Thr protein kinase)
VKIDIQPHALRQPLSDDIKVLIFECIRELLFNVAKYAAISQATVILREEEDVLHVVVLDEGAGFDVESATNKQQTDGFGLFSIRERIAALDGSMSLESSPGTGTRIALTVPIPKTVVLKGPADPSAPLRTDKAAASAQSSSLTNGRTRVLVVDDHAMIREGLANMINIDERLVVIGEAANGIEAIMAVEKEVPDVILMDLNMPRMNGIEATREIRRRWPAVAIVGLSVQSDLATAKSMIEAGAARFLSKAGDTEQMITTILELAPVAPGVPVDP